MCRALLERVDIFIQESRQARERFSGSDAAAGTELTYFLDHKFRFSKFLTIQPNEYQIIMSSFYQYGFLLQNPETDIRIVFCFLCHALLVLLSLSQLFEYRNITVLKKTAILVARVD